MGGVSLMRLGLWPAVADDVSGDIQNKSAIAAILSAQIAVPQVAFPQRPYGPAAETGATHLDAEWHIPDGCALDL
jgi:hypothetical protein